MIKIGITKSWNIRMRGSDVCGGHVLLFHGLMHSLPVPLVYDAITNTNPQKFVKKVTYSRSAQYFNFLKSTKFYIKKKKNQIISLKNRKVRAFASVCAKIYVYFRIRTYFFYFTYSLFKIQYIKLYILHYIH